MTDLKKLAPEQLTEIKENFNFFDRDSNNEIDLGEFTKLLRVISPTATLEQAQKGFELIDENKDGHIDFNEFMTWWETCWWEY
ncbi:MAG: EF-hand domain-containing protein [Kangiellaceae bacterium]|nr:EF-hand domain-containing protein [Kangiellaceae bacterium]